MTAVHVFAKTEYTADEVISVRKEDEKKTHGWEMVDPKPPVIQSGHMETRTRNGA